MKQLRSRLAVKVLFIVLLHTAQCLANNNNKKRAFVTIVTTKEDVEPAMVMGSSLRAMTRSSSSSSEYICLVLREEEVEEKPGDDDDDKVGVSLLDRKKLTFAGWTTIPVTHSISNTNFDGNNHSWEDVDWNILWLWSLQEYETIVYAEVSNLIIQDITELFDIQVHFAAAPQLFSSHQFDTAVLVLKPNIVTFQDMMIKIPQSKNSISSREFLNNYFSEWYSGNFEHRLLPLYNAPYHWTQYQESDSWESYRSDVKVIHFQGESEKPWLVLRENYPVSKYGAPIIYVWAIVLYFIANPIANKSNNSDKNSSLEDETRYVLTKIFDVTKSSKKIAFYIEKIKRGGTRLRIGIHDHDGEL